MSVIEKWRANYRRDREIGIRTLEEVMKRAGAYRVARYFAAAGGVLFAFGALIGSYMQMQTVGMVMWSVLYVWELFLTLLIFFVLIYGSVYVVWFWKKFYGPADKDVRRQIGKA